FGGNLADSTASATLDANGQLPTELAFRRVEVNGVESRLIYVSPGQINFVVPRDIPSGTTTVVVFATDTNTTRTGAVAIAASAPGIFSSDATGRGPGAILNAVTFAPGPFVTATAENGIDTRTRLAVYGTGFRRAQNVTASVVSARTGSFDVTVLYANLAPGFSGLDQLNFIVPPELDGAGTVSFTIATEDGTSNTVTFQMDLLPVSSLQLAVLSLSPVLVNGGQTMTATLTLNGVARFGGFTVPLRSNNPVAQVPPVATILQGLASMDVI